MEGEDSSLYVKQDEESILYEQPLITEQTTPDLSALEKSDIRVED